MSFFVSDSLKGLISEKDLTININEKRKNNKIYAVFSSKKGKINIEIEEITKTIKNNNILLKMYCSIDYLESIFFNDMCLKHIEFKSKAKKIDMVCFESAKYIKEKKLYLTILNCKYSN